jgi:hypothetical protein
VAAHDPSEHRGPAVTSRRLLVIGLLLIALVMLGAWLRVRPVHPNRTAHRQPIVSTVTHLGVYVGAGDISAFKTFKSWLGARPGYVSDYLASTSWATISEPDWLLSRWSHSGARLVLSVPMLPTSGTATLAAEAHGADDAVFRRLAERLVAGGGATTILRLGWEFNGDWFPWSIQNGRGAEYAEAWRQIVTTMRAVSGERFKFDWCVNGGSSLVNGVRLDPAAAWPGDAYVNFVGLDQYDAAPATIDTAASRWQLFVGQPYGLAWQRAFAHAHNKPVSFPEWGLLLGGDSAAGQVGGGDSAVFVQEMFDWFAGSDIAYEAYFDVDTSVGASALSSFPRAAVRYRGLALRPGSENGPVKR